MDVFKDLEDLNENLKKLRDSIYENGVIHDSTKKQQDTFYKMLKVLLNKTITYMDYFNDKNHVIQTNMDLDKMNNAIATEDISFYLKTFEEKLDWYYDNETKKVDDGFIAAADMVILWPLRAINERMYRYLFTQKFDTRFDKFFEEINDIKD